MVYCHHKGYLINARHSLPESMSAHDNAWLPTIGCSNLRCLRCGAMVRSATGIAFATKNDVALEQLAALYEMPDLLQSPLIHQTQSSWRLYLCRCDRWLEINETALEPPDPDDAAGKPWRCAGHTLATLPYRDEGVKIANVEALREFTQHGLRNELAPPVCEVDRENIYWLLRLHSQLEPDMAMKMTEEAANNLAEKDAVVLARSLWFLFFTATSAIREQVFMLIENKSDSLLLSVPVGLTRFDKTLADLAWTVVGCLFAEEGRARDYARAQAMVGHMSKAMLDPLAIYDSDWLLQHLEDIALSSPAKAGLLIDCLVHLPDEKMSTHHTIRIREALIAKDVQLEPMTAAARALAKVLIPKHASKDVSKPVEQLFAVLSDNTTLTLQISKKNKEEQELQLKLRIARPRKKVLSFMIMQDSKILIKIFLESKQAAERIFFVALQVLPVPFTILASDSSITQVNDSDKSKASKASHRKHNLNGIINDRERQIYEATCVLADKMDHIAASGTFEFVYQTIGPIDGSGEAELRLAPNPLEQELRFIELCVHTASGKSWMARWISQGSNSELQTFLRDELTPALIIKTSRELLLKLFKEEYL